MLGWLDDGCYLAAWTVDVMTPESEKISTTLGGFGRDALAFLEEACISQRDRIHGSNP